MLILYIQYPYILLVKYLDKKQSGQDCLSLAWSHVAASLVSRADEGV